MADSYIKGNFPSQVVSDKEKLSQEYGLKIGKASAALAASIFHFGEFSIQDAKKYLASKGIAVRI